MGLALLWRLLAVVLLLLPAVLQDPIHGLTVVGAISGHGVSGRLFLLTAALLRLLASALSLLARLFPTSWLLTAAVLLPGSLPRPRLLACWLIPA